MKLNETPTLTTKLGGLCINTVLDNAFTSVSEMAPEAHAHAFYELILSDSGEIGIDIHGKNIPVRHLSLKEGEACLIAPNIYHCTKQITDKAVKLALRFSCVFEETASSLRSLCIRALNSCSSYLITENCEKLYKITREIKEELRSNSPEYDEYVNLLLGQLYINLFRIVNTVDSSGINSEAQLIQKQDAEGRRIIIEEYLFNHFSEHITEDDLAKEMHLSKRQLSRVIYSLFGSSFRQLLSDVRLNRAAQLLTETDYSLDHIAASVGYGSLSGFYSAFRAKFSLSVGQYRRAFGKK